MKAKVKNDKHTGYGEFDDVCAFEDIKINGGEVEISDECVGCIAWVNRFPNNTMTM